MEFYIGFLVGFHIGFLVGFLYCFYGSFVLVFLPEVQMLIRIRTVDGWIEVSEQEVRRLLACSYGNEGPAVIEHNAFMNQYYPIEERAKEAQ
jgi:hypothetical protein